MSALTPDMHRTPVSAGISILAFKPMSGSGSLRGFVDVHIPAWRLRLFGCPVHESHGRRWVGLPSRPQIDRDGVAVRDEEKGKVRYFPVIGFDDVEVLHRFSDATVAALEIYNPDAFGPGSGYAGNSDE